MPVHRYQLPAGFSPGLIIGKRGSRIQNLQRSTGCRLKVSGQQVIITYRGSGELENCIGELNKIVNNNKKLFAHPVQAFSIVPDGVQNMRFEALHEAFSSNQLDTLVTQPVLNEEISSKDSMSQITAQMGSMRIDSKKAPLFVHESKAKALIADQYQDYLKRIEESQQNKEVRFRFSLGYHGLRHSHYGKGEEESIKNLNNQPYGRSFRSLFANTVEQEVVQLLRENLPKLGYNKEDRDDMEISMHFLETSTEEYINVKREGKIDSEGNIQWKDVSSCTTGKQKLCLINWVMDPTVPHVRLRYDISDVKPLTETQKEFVSNFDWDLKRNILVRNNSRNNGSLKEDSIRCKEVSTFVNSDNGMLFEIETVREANNTKTEIVVQFPAETMHPNEAYLEVLRVMRGLKKE